MDRNIIYNEDCFETMSSKLKPNSIDIVITSPPYNMTRRKGGVSDTGRYDVYTDWKVRKNIPNGHITYLIK